MKVSFLFLGSERGSRVSKKSWVFSFFFKVRKNKNRAFEGQQREHFDPRGIRCGEEGREREDEQERKRKREKKQR